ncbi:hypothetical protein ACTFIR_006256 [Dictyostelium discoideum]
MKIKNNTTNNLTSQGEATNNCVIQFKKKTAIRNDKSIKGIKLNNENNLKVCQFADYTVTGAMNQEEEKKINELILKFCDSTSAKINADKCVCIAINNKSNTIYRKMDEEGEERYFGFNFGRLAILKSYLLSQLTFHLYISEIENLTQLETIFKGNNKWKMSKKRCRKDYAMGGLELWNMELRVLAQKAWIYEWYLRDKDTFKCSSFMNKWKSESLNNLSITLTKRKNIY